MFEPVFRSLLPRFVAGEIDPEDLESAAVNAGIERRVLGVLPAATRYVGRPVWAQRETAGDH